MKTKKESGENPDEKEKGDVMKEITLDNHQLSPEDKYQVGPKWEKARRDMEKRKEKEGDIDYGGYDEGDHPSNW